MDTRTQAGAAAPRAAIPNTLATCEVVPTGAALGAEIRGLDLETGVRNRFAEPGIEIRKMLLEPFDK